MLAIARPRVANAPKQFVRRVDAQRWLNETNQALIEGRYVDPRAGRITLHEYAEDWLGRQAQRPTTAEQMEGVVRRYIDPPLGSMRLGTIQPSDIQRWVKQRSRTLAPSTAGVAHRILSGILKSAVADRRIVSNPCAGTKVPEVTKPKVQPITEDQLAAIVEHMPRRHQALVILAAGTGFRQGEIFGSHRRPRQSRETNRPGQPPARQRQRAPRELPLDHARLQEQRGRPGAALGVLDGVEPRPQTSRRAG